MANLISLNSDGSVVTGEDFSKISLENHSFTNCSFQKCNFSESLVRNAQFSTCRFQGCNFSLVKLDGCRIQDCQFLDCKIVGADFFKCDKVFFSATFKNCLLHYCNFTDLKMKNASLIGSTIRESHFTNTGLQGADFSGSDLSGTIFHNCDLSKADFSTAMNYTIDPHANKIKKAIFSLPEVLGLLRGFDITLL